MNIPMGLRIRGHKFERKQRMWEEWRRKREVRNDTIVFYIENI